ncbi:SbcD-like subunit of palindrome specific endonuclease [Citrobacter phage Moon]|uniref:Recombination endonuclease subunit n=2 Tax=root TaxID=1 RepID=A0A0A0YVD3_9CAUD|nr:SbcD-like subunit of palindrome specific endonuclease [Citrobacter phage Moon]AIX12030.1 recombination endonuclease subunit [Citrobacter phage Moon]
MKILHTGDWHLGVKGDDPWLQEIQRDGIRQKIEYSKKHGITVWIQYGDIFDVRKAITHKTMEFAREIVDMLAEAGITMHTIIGNHDMHYKNKIHPNAITEVLGKHDHIKIYDVPTTVDFDGCLIDLIPWLCEENVAQIMKHVKESSAEYCVGHWELNGFYFYKGLKSHGLEPDFLKQYKQVWSGHFHTISEAANIKYIGTPWTLTAGDENDPRGFWVQDTRLRTFDFIPNETTWHRKIFYPVTGPIDFNDYKDLSVRVVITEVDKDLPKFESELEKVVHELRTVSKIDNSLEVEDGEEVEVKGLLEIMEEYINSLPDLSDDDRTAVILYANQLYTEVTNS